MWASFSRYLAKVMFCEEAIRLLACTTGAGAQPRPAAVASAPKSSPVRTIRLRPVGAADALVDTNPVLRTVGEGPCEFARIVSIVIASDGGVSAAEATTNSICVFDRSGRQMFRFGRGGAGPGEFNAIEKMIGLTGDSLLVFDHLLRRATVFTQNGRLHRTFRFQRVNGDPESPFTILPLTDGNFVVGVVQPPEDHRAPGVHEFHQLLSVSTAEGLIQRDIRLVLATEYFTQVVANAFGGLAFWDRVLARRGSVVLIGDREFLYGDGSSLQFSRYNAKGARTATYRGDEGRRAVTARDVNEFRESGARERVDPRFESLRARRVAQMVFPDSYPSFRRVISDAANGSQRFWIEEYPTFTATSERWRSVQLDGTMGGWVRFPKRFVLMAIRSGTACGYRRDEDDVPRVECYRLPGSTR